MKVFKPLNGRVVIKVDKPQEFSVGGILLPATYSTVDSNIRTGVVKEISQEETLLKIDDQVIISWNGEQFEVDNEKYVILESKDVLAKVE